MYLPSRCVRPLAALLLAVAAMGQAAAQASGDCPPPPTAESLREVFAQPPRDHGLLWRLDKDGRTSWLYGTLHATRPE